MESKFSRVRKFAAEVANTTRKTVRIVKAMLVAKYGFQHCSILATEGYLGLL